MDTKDAIYILDNVTKQVDDVRFFQTDTEASIPRIEKLANAVACLVEVVRSQYQK